MIVGSLWVYEATLKLDFSKTGMGKIWSIEEKCQHESHRIYSGTLCNISSSAYTPGKSTITWYERHN